jgi:hypothetical protein
MENNGERRMGKDVEDDGSDLFEDSGIHLKKLRKATRNLMLAGKVTRFKLRMGRVAQSV